MCMSTDIICISINIYGYMSVNIMYLNGDVEYIVDRQLSRIRSQGNGNKDVTIMSGYENEFDQQDRLQIFVSSVFKKRKKYEEEKITYPAVQLHSAELTFPVTLDIIIQTL